MNSSLAVVVFLAMELLSVLLLMAIASLDGWM
jgi:hypothetical protein